MQTKIFKNIFDVCELHASVTTVRAWEQARNNQDAMRVLIALARKVESEIEVTVHDLNQVIDTAIDKLKPHQQREIIQLELDKISLGPLCWAHEEHAIRNNIHEEIPVILLTSRQRVRNLTLQLQRFAASPLIDIPGVKKIMKQRCFVLTLGHCE